mmetsp:Transcript_79676/g.133457  ORF Transcript_79676/g.133457 Transcript_79676/m.133457 type:complete len:207 (-) Transcript_79676:429-1049(-)
MNLPIRTPLFSPNVSSSTSYFMSTRLCSRLYILMYNSSPTDAMLCSFSLASAMYSTTYISQISNSTSSKLICTFTSSSPRFCGFKSPSHCTDPEAGLGLSARTIIPSFNALPPSIAMTTIVSIWMGGSAAGTSQPRLKTTERASSPASANMYFSPLASVFSGLALRCQAFGMDSSVVRAVKVLSMKAFNLVVFVPTKVNNFDPLQW